MTAVNAHLKKGCRLEMALARSNHASTRMMRHKRRAAVRSAVDGV
jgi:hypothetical protein